MTLVVDAAPLIALADRADPRRDAVRALLREEEGDLIVPAQVTAVVAELERSYHDLDLGLADCSIVVLAHRFGSTRLAHVRRTPLPNREAPARRCVHAPAAAEATPAKRRTRCRRRRPA